VAQLTGADCDAKSQIMILLSMAYNMATVANGPFGGVANGKVLAFQCCAPIWLPMAILLRCDCCGRTTTAPRLSGTGRLDLRGSEGWWLVGAGVDDAVTACSEQHLNQALAERRRYPVITCSFADEQAYA
jgi:hypothetical protein